MKTAAGLYILSKACSIGLQWNIVFCILIIKIIILLHVGTIRSNKEKSKDLITCPFFSDLSSQYISQKFCHF